MASFIENGESIFIPFRNERSISDSQMKPRMYKTIQAFEKSFPKHYLGMDGVELVEYAPVVHGRWVGLEYDGYADGCPVYDLWECSVCGFEHAGEDDTLPNFCPHCGSKMNGR